MTLIPSEPTTPCAHLDLLEGKPYASVGIALLPIRHSWEAFALLNWGGWNACPLPEENCAAFRYWGERYGAKIISITHDIVECTVERLPKDPEEALELAEEQYAYCTDLVDQGTGTLENLAASLLVSHTWFFWWD